MTFAEKVMSFNSQLHFSGKLPKGIRIMNPFKENAEVLSLARSFYHKFYHDNHPRKIILGINPGRLGAGATGIPFTDTKRLAEICDIKAASVSTHEPSSVFIYDVIKQFGGVEKFYNAFYINSICPLGFIRLNEKNNWINCNYYDHPELFEAVKLFIISSLKKQISFGIDRQACFILGRKNAKYFKAINDQEKFFKQVVVLDHPRYIEQYKSLHRGEYLAEYVRLLSSC
jgi:Uracil DNA glycosylase superfamily